MKKERILIIDDSRVIMSLLTDILNPYYEVFLLSEGCETLETVKRVNPSLILLDIIMPQISGFEIIKELKSDPRTIDIPVIFLTGLNDEIYEERGLNLGAVDYIAKPFKSSIVCARVRTHIKLHLYQKRIEALTLIDGLTDINNRRAFDECIVREWEEHQDKNLPLSLLILDTDFFKLYNDTYGHPSGDDILYLLAQTMKDTLSGPEDMVARYGGEEFAVILPYADAMKCKGMAVKIMQAVNELKLMHNASPISDHVTLSIGATTVIPNDRLSIGQLVKAADAMLYSAKETGRNKYCWQSLE